MSNFGFTYMDAYLPAHLGHLERLHEPGYNHVIRIEGPSFNGIDNMRNFLLRAELKNELDIIIKNAHEWCRENFEDFTYRAVNEVHFLRYDFLFPNKADAMRFKLAVA